MLQEFINSCILQTSVACRFPQSKIAASQAISNLYNTVSISCYYWILDILVLIIARLLVCFNFSSSHLAVPEAKLKKLTFVTFRHIASSVSFSTYASLDTLRAVVSTRPMEDQILFNSIFILFNFHDAKLEKTLILPGTGKMGARNFSLGLRKFL